MTIHGIFRNLNGDLMDVHMEGNPNDGTKIEIGKDNDVFFTDDPVTIEVNNDDTFNTVIATSATVRLHSKRYLGSLLFSRNATDIRVNIRRNGDLVFAGFVEPSTYSQPFASVYDDMEINCIDALSALQYYTYNMADTANYENIKSEAANATFLDILTKARELVGCIRIINNSKLNFYYDTSKGITADRTQTVFDDLAVNELVFLGEDEKDVLTYKDVLDEILKYLNLHVIQRGQVCYIFDWDSLRSGNTAWYDVLNKRTVPVSTERHVLEKSLHASNDGNVTIGEVFNQISVKCDITKQDTVIENPLDDSKLTSPYQGKVLYCTEYSSKGDGHTANDAINDMLNGRPTEYDAAKEVDWYIQPVCSKNWKLNTGGGHTVEDTYIKDSNGRYINAWESFYTLRKDGRQIVPYLVSMGKVERKAKANDNSPVSRMSMDNYLYISVNGNGDDTEQGHSPSDATLSGSTNICEYKGNIGGGSISPLDDETKNYLVFSGSLTLQPVSLESSSSVCKSDGTYYDCLANGVAYDKKRNVLRMEDNGDAYYYTTKYYKLTNGSDNHTNATDSGSTHCFTSGRNIMPYCTEKFRKMFKYNYSNIGDGTDKISKIPILECELTIGNKRLIEKSIDKYGNSEFEWVEVGKEPTVNGARKTTFSLGINPKIGDFIIGTEFKLQNNIHYSMNLDKEGTAIPIEKKDKLSGKINFKIVGPYNATWDDVVRVHGTFWRHTKWNANTKFILAHTDNIILKNFKCEIVTDGGGGQTFEDNDLVYTSVNDSAFKNKKDDINFKLMTQLSSEESISKGIKPTINLNSVMDTTTWLPLKSLYNRVTGECAKAEEHYINSYYQEYHIPKIVYGATLKGCYKPTELFTFPTLNKEFYILSSKYNGADNTTTLSLKEK